MCQEIFTSTYLKIKAKLKEVQKELAKRKSECISLWAAGEYMLDVEFCKRAKNNDILIIKRELYPR